MDRYNENTETELAALGRQRRKLTRELAENRSRQRPLIVAAARARVPQVRIVELSGYTRDAVRRICRAAGVAPESEE